MKEKKTVIPEKFPEKLKVLRQSQGWSQGQLAKKINADVQRVSKYERGLICPSTEAVIRLAMAFNVSLDYLLRGENNVAINKIKNTELLKRVEKIDTLKEDDQDLLVRLLDVFIKQKQLEAVMQSSL